MSTRSKFRIYFSLIVGSFLIGLSGCGSPAFEYSIEAKLDPHGISPLTALIQVQSKKECRASIKVLGEIPVEQSFETNAFNLEIPVVGLYPNKTNNVVVPVRGKPAPIIFNDMIF
jgi:arylsulfate sulfotransferase